MTTAPIKFDALKDQLFAMSGQYTEDRKIIAAFLNLELPALRGGLTGGHFGTDQPYTDYSWGGNVVRYASWGMNGQKPFLEVIA